MITYRVHSVPIAPILKSTYMMAYRASRRLWPGRMVLFAKDVGFWSVLLQIAEFLRPLGCPSRWILDEQPRHFMG